MKGIRDKYPKKFKFTEKFELGGVFSFPTHCR